MNKMNKKGFTLIEMLVVIAIIAVLVSIIIPTVTSATDKAAAAANAANLRSLKAEIVTAYLTNDETKWLFNDDGTVSLNNPATGDPTYTLPEFKAVATDATADDKFEANYDNNGNITVKWEGLNIAQWAAKAGDSPEVTSEP